MFIVNFTASVEIDAEDIEEAKRQAYDLIMNGYAEMEIESIVEEV